jgi:hypothetical protein
MTFEEKFVAYNEECKAVQTKIFGKKGLRGFLLIALPEDDDEPCMVEMMAGKRDREVLEVLLAVAKNLAEHPEEAIRRVDNESFS